MKYFTILLRYYNYYLTRFTLFVIILGRSVQIHVTKKNVTRLLRLAVNYGEFDWVIYDWKGYARLSVIPDGKYQ